TIAVRPAVDGDRRNISRAGEPARAKHAVELVPDFLLEIRACHSEQRCCADTKLRARIKPGIGRPRHVLEVQQHRLAWIAWMAVAAKADGKVERHARMERH